MVVGMARIAVIGLVFAALLTGPAAAACGDCCPKSQTPVSVAAAQACCGDCGATLERAPDPVTLAEAKAPLDPAAATGAGAAEVGRPSSHTAGAALTAATVASPRSSLPRPLRL